MSPDARRRWGRRGREIAERRLSWSHVAEAFEALILEARGAGAPGPAAGNLAPSAVAAKSEFGLKPRATL